MMTPKKRATWIVLISVILAIIFLLVLWFLFFRGKPKVVPASTATKTPVVTQPAQTSPTVSQQVTAQEKQTRTEAAGVIALSKLFTERYGSWSNEADFQNVRDLIPLMSKSFAASTTASLTTKKIPTGFYGITTRVITVTVVKNDEKAGVATVDLDTQRQEERGTAQNMSIKYQKIELTFVKESGVWVVDSATWL